MIQPGRPRWGNGWDVVTVLGGKSRNVAGDDCWGTRGTSCWRNCSCFPSPGKEKRFLYGNWQTSVCLSCFRETLPKALRWSLLSIWAPRHSEWAWSTWGCRGLQGALDAWPCRVLLRLHFRHWDVAKDTDWPQTLSCLSPVHPTWSTALVPPSPPSALLFSEALHSFIHSFLDLFAWFTKCAPSQNESSPWAGTSVCSLLHLQLLPHCLPGSSCLINVWQMNKMFDPGFIPLSALLALGKFLNLWAPAFLSVNSNNSPSDQKGWLWRSQVCPPLCGLLLPPESVWIWLTVGAGAQVQRAGLWLMVRFYGLTGRAGQNLPSSSLASTRRRSSSGCHSGFCCPSPWGPLLCLRQACALCTDLFSHSVVSDSLRPHGLQHAGLPCPLPTPGACSDSCLLSWWCHPTILSSVAPFSWL